MDDRISAIPYSPCPPQSNLLLINDDNNDTLLNINDERDVNHKTEKHQYGIFEKREDEDDIKHNNKVAEYSCDNDNNDDCIILGKDWWISSDYFDDPPQDDKVLQEFDAIYNSNNSDIDSESQTRCNVHYESQNA